ERLSLQGNQPPRQFLELGSALGRQRRKARLAGFGGSDDKVARLERKRSSRGRRTVWRYRRFQDLFQLWWQQNQPVRGGNADDRRHVVAVAARLDLHVESRPLAGVRLQDERYFFVLVRQARCDAQVFKCRVLVVVNARDDHAAADPGLPRG